MSTPTARSANGMKRTVASIPALLAVPVLFWLAFARAGIPSTWSWFGLGALGWTVAMVLRGPIALLAKSLLPKQAETLVVAASGPLEEGVRLGLIALTGAFTLPAAVSVGQGWAAVEVVFAIVNGVALQALLGRDDEKARQARELLQQQGRLDIPPVWGAVERIFAGAAHVGNTLLIARHPWLLVVTVPLHSAINLSIKPLLRRGIAVTEGAVAIVGTALLAAGLLLFR